MKRTRRVLSALLPVIAALSACGARPPGCADEATVGVIRSIINDALNESFANVETVAPDLDAKERVRKLGSGFVASLKITVTEVVSNGYNSDARKFTCAAKLTVTEALTGQGLERQINYTTQRTEDNKSNFVVSVEALRPFIEGLTAAPLLAYMKAKDVAERSAASVAATTSTTSQPPAADAALPQPKSAVADDPAEPPRDSPSAAEASRAPIAQSTVPEVAAAAQVTPPPVGPSFNCAAASTQAERMICSNKELAEADARMASAFRQLLASAPDKEALKAAQAAWRKGERDTCLDVACMRAAYQRRITQLESSR